MRACGFFGIACEMCENPELMGAETVEQCTKL
jgi:hypothetical protein